MSFYGSCSISKDMVHADYKKCDISGLTATEQLEAINKEAKEFVSTQYSTYNRSLKPALRREYNL